LIKRKETIGSFAKDLMSNEEAKVLVVGGGYTSIELACAIKHSTKRPVTLICRSAALCKTFNTKAQKLIPKYMTEILGIEVLLSTTLE
jgi:pyruvate/2-oxoglutarate dehydrogenase complex dihydrolipoamide dehydrogenase (E3) component